MVFRSTDFFIVVRRFFAKVMSGMVQKKTCIKEMEILFLQIRIFFELEWKRNILK